MNRKFLLPTLYFLISGIGFLGMQGGASALDNDGIGQQTGMPIHFKAEKPGFVTLVLEDKHGNRLKNLAQISTAVQLAKNYPGTITAQ